MPLTERPLPPLSLQATNAKKRNENSKLFFDASEQVITNEVMGSTPETITRIFNECARAIIASVVLNYLHGLTGLVVITKGKSEIKGSSPQDNWPLSNSLQSLFQGESKREVFVMNISFHLY